MKYQDDSFYIERILKGDTAAYSLLVAKHKNLVFSIALKILNSREDAEEVAQDAFIKAYQSLGSFERKSKFSTWLYRIVYNTAISKTRKKRPEFVPVDNYLIDNASDGELPFSANEPDSETRLAALQNALKKLNEEDYTLITLFYFGEKSVEEISFISGLSESNVKVRLHRIRKKLYEEMNPVVSEVLKK